MASGDTLLLFHAYMNEPTSGSYATLDHHNQHVVLDFDQDDEEYAVFAGIMPQNYSGTTGVTVYIHWLTSVTTGDVDWDVYWELLGDDEQSLDSDGFATANGVDDCAPGSSAYELVIDSIAFTDGADMDSVQAGDGFRLKIRRDAGSDTATADAMLRFIEVRET